MVFEVKEGQEGDRSFGGMDAVIVCRSLAEGNFSKVIRVAVVLKLGLSTKLFLVLTMKRFVEPQCD